MAWLLDTKMIVELVNRMLQRIDNFFVRGLTMGLGILILVIAACEPEPPATPPPLPFGFAEALVPDVELLAYTYVNQGQPFIVSGEILAMGKAQESKDASVHSLALWDGPTLAATAVRASLGTSQEAEAIAEHLTLQVADLSIQSKGATLHVVGGLDDGRDVLEAAIQEDRYTVFKDRFPEVWKTLLFLPQNPERTPTAAGFVKIGGDLSESVSSISGLRTLDNFIGALKTARIDHVGFGVYAAQPLSSISSELTLEDIERFGAVVVLVARSGYPSVAFSPVFQAIVRSQGLTEIKESDRSIFVGEYGGLQFALSNKGNVIFGAASAHQGDALRIIEKTLRGG